MEAVEHRHWEVGEFSRKVGVILKKKKKRKRFRGVVSAQDKTGLATRGVSSPSSGGGSRAGSRGS